MSDFSFSKYFDCYYLDCIMSRRVLCPFLFYDFPNMFKTTTDRVEAIKANHKSVSCMMVCMTNLLFIWQRFEQYLQCLGYFPNREWLEIARRKQFFNFSIDRYVCWKVIQQIYAFRRSLAASFKMLLDHITFSAPRESVTFANSSSV